MSLAAQPLFGPLTYTARGRFKPFGYVYILRWDSELVKFGSSSNPYVRLQQHCRYLGDGLQIIGAILKFASPQLASEVERHIHHEFKEMHVRDELFKMPKVAQQDAATVNELGATLRHLFVQKLNLIQKVPEKGWWEMSAASWDDPLIHVVETPCYWDQNGPMPDAPKVIHNRWNNPSYRATTAAAAEADRRREEMRERRKDPAFNAARLAQVRDPAYRAELSEATRKRWQDPAFRTVRSEAIREAVHQRWEDPDYRTARLEAIRKQSEDPGYRAAQSAAMRKRWKDPEYQSTRREAMRQKWQDPTYRDAKVEALRKQAQDPAYRAAQAERTRKQWQDPAIRTVRSEAIRKAKRACWQTKPSPNQLRLF